MLIKIECGLYHHSNSKFNYIIILTCHIFPTHFSPLSISFLPGKHYYYMRKGKKKKFYLVFPIYELKQVTLLLSQFFILKENIPQTNIALNNMTELQKILGTKISETNHPCSAKFDTGLNTFLPYYLYYFLV